MTTTTNVRAIAALLGLWALLAACSWSVPADPGLNTRLRGGSAWVPTTGGAVGGAAALSEGGHDPGAREIYLRRCAQCHEAIHPTALPASAWPAAVRKFGPRAGLFGQERQRVLRWLMANAR